MKQKNKPTKRLTIINSYENVNSHWVDGNEKKKNRRLLLDNNGNEFDEILLLKSMKM